MISELLSHPKGSCLKLKHFIFCFFLCCSVIHSHGNLSIRIQQKTVEISKNPNNSKLYFERGFLYQQHFEYGKAISDFNKSEILGYTTALLYFRKAEALLANNQPLKALEATNRIFKENNDDSKIYKLRAQIYYALNEYSKALKSYQYVLKNMKDIGPSDILEYSEIILAKNPTNYKDALEVIETGLEKIGEQTLTLNLKKLDYLIASKNNEKVIEQYNFFITSSKRKENWYYKKAIYLRSIGKDAEANIALQQAKTAIVLLKPKTQNTIAIKRLVSQIYELENTLTL